MSDPARNPGLRSSPDDGIHRADDFPSVLAAAKTGEEWAWTWLFRRFAGPVTGYLIGRGSPDPEATAGETFLQVAKGINRFDGDEESFRSWLFVIAHRRMIDARRAASRRPILTPLESQHLDSPVADPEHEVLDPLMTDEMTEALQRLTDPQREVLLLRIVADLSLEEVASIMGKRVGAIKALQRRALTAVKAHLESRSVSR
jgi:RNA polymerase sigma-70 factor, ECF subfamily